jgi:hypothetical protein
VKIRRGEKEENRKASAKRARRTREQEEYHLDSVSVVENMKTR